MLLNSLQFDSIRFCFFFCFHFGLRGHRRYCFVVWNLFIRCWAKGKNEIFIMIISKSKYCLCLKKKWEISNVCEQHLIFGQRPYNSVHCTLHTTHRAHIMNQMVSIKCDWAETRSETSIKFYRLGMRTPPLGLFWTTLNIIISLFLSMDNFFFFIFPNTCCFIWLQVSFSRYPPIFPSNDHFSGSFLDSKQRMSTSKFTSISHFQCKIKPKLKFNAQQKCKWVSISRCSY